MIKCVIFDLDGTLLNTLKDLKDSTNFALSSFGYPERTLDEIRNFVGDGVKKLIERALPQDAKNIDECLAIFKKYYAQNMYNKTVPYNSILNILKELKIKDIKIAVVSNKFDTAVKELCKKYFDGFIDIALGQSEFIPPKPSPDGVIKVMSDLGVNTENTIYVGDSEVDVQTAKNSGLKCIGVTWGFRDKEKLIKADYIIDNPNELIQIIDEI